MVRRVVPQPFPEDPVVGSIADFGAAVRAARTSCGLTLEQAAMTIGVAKQTLQDLERGTASVRLELALRIARELGVAVFATPATEREQAARLLRSLRAS